MAHVGWGGGANVFINRVVTALPTKQYRPIAVLCIFIMQLSSLSISRQECRVVAGKPRDAAVHLTHSLLFSDFVIYELRSP